MSDTVIKLRPLSDEDKTRCIEKVFLNYSNNDLLLGYLENPAKLKPHLINKEEHKYSTEQTKDFNYSEPPIPRKTYFINENDRDSENRDEMMWQIKKLRKQHKNIDIPPVDELTSTSSLASVLRNVMREVNFHEKTEASRDALMMLLVALEYFGTQYAGLNISGFAMTQMNNMNDYEKFLIDVSEKGYMSWSDKTAPELKLIVVLFKNLLLYLAGDKASTRETEYHDVRYKMRGPR